MSRNLRTRHFPLWLSTAALAGVLTPAAATAAPITYTDIASNPATGISYRRKESATDAIFDAIKLKPFLSLEELFNSPQKPQGAPGVAVLDYDRDGDLDIYVTNGPGRANGLYQNQLAQTGQTRFVDVAVAAGVDAAAQDSTGVCYGDVDNDGDEDLLVLGRMEPNRLFANNGNGTFTNISASAGIAGTVLGHTSCSMGDVNNDGLLDIYVANTHDWSSLQAIFNHLFGHSHKDQLYLNQGSNHFQDVSESSGVLNLFNVPPGDGTITWATALVDYDQDGDADIMQADDQGAMATAGFAGVDRGFLQLHKNDGTGHFTNVTATSGSTKISSSWMGLSFGDLNCDDHLDLFATNTGDYMLPQMGIPKPPGLDSSRFHIALSDGSGVFTTPEQLPNGLHATPFGWGTGMADYDNDGDTDIIFYGNINAVGFATADNPGIILRNEGCTATFSWDQAATAASAEFVARQTVDGLALGDLNDDGFTDMVYAAGMYAPPTLPLVRMTNQFGSVFDATAFMVPTFYHIGPFEWEWAGRNVEEGFMGVQISSANNGNRWVKVSVKGAKGLTPRGKVNRDGIGAMVKFKPNGGKQVMMPVLGGSSYQSQHSLSQGFGLGTATRGTLDIVWPGRVRNRLYEVRAGDRVTFPEIPCDFAATTWANRRAYRMCVKDALDDFVDAHVITKSFSTRLLESAIKAYDDTH